MATDFPEATIKKGDAGVGIKRKWLKSFEVLPAQLLNSYGRAQFSSMPDDKLWEYSWLAFLY